tara:strand:+ start:23603 stop:24304 length:702 start_codon:yes stop_codon:yes gene_type:complete
MLSDGQSIAMTAKTLNINRGTVHRWKKSKAFHAWHADRYLTKDKPKAKAAAKKARKAKQQEAQGGTVQKEVDVQPNLQRVQPPAHLDRKKWERFIEAHQVGAQHYARDYAGIDEDEERKYLLEFAARYARANPRVKVLNRMLAQVFDPKTPASVRTQTAMQWWKMSESETALNPTGPLVHIDATGGSDAGPPPHMVAFFAGMQEVMDEAADLKLMDESQGDAIRQKLREREQA